MPSVPIGALFVGVARPAMRAYLYQVLQAARSRYDRLIEPGCGPFTFAQVAVNAGWKPEQIETSDVSLFSEACAAAIEDRRVTGVSLASPVDLDIDLEDPADVLLIQQLCVLERRYGTSRQTGAGLYMRGVIRSMKDSWEKQRSSMREQLARLRKQLHGISYEPIDMVEHIERTASDARTLILLWPPTFRGGYERLGDTGDRLRWANQPTYRFWDPKVDTTALQERLAAGEDDSLMMVGLECESHELRTTAVFAEGGVRAAAGMGAKTINCYLIANRPFEVEALATRKAVERPGRGMVAKPRLVTLPPTQPISQQSQLQAVGIAEDEANYWRLLWTHNMKPVLGRSLDVAILLDGFLVGLIGFDFIIPTGAAVLTYHLGLPVDDRQRWQRLAIRAALSRPVLEAAMKQRAWSAQYVTTAMFQRHPASSVQRGLMKLYSRTHDARRGFHLIYRAPIADRDLDTTWQDQWRDDVRWRRSRTPAPAGR